MVTLQDSYRGALLGVLVGDAIGAPYETWGAQKIATDFAQRGGLTLFDYPDPWHKDGIFPAGRPTDDSELTAALAESLLERGGCDQDDQFRRFKRVAGGESLLWEGEAVGFGRNTLRILSADSFAQSLELPELATLPTNGSMMRSAPLALFYHGDLESMMVASEQSSFVTHRHPVAIDSTLLFVGLLNEVLLGHSPSQALINTRSLGLTEPGVYELSYDLFPPRHCIPPKFPSRGGAVLTLQAALWAFLSAHSYREGIENVIGLGGDTDTYAAVAGALLGARFGESGIPEEWLAGVKGVDRMRELATNLFEMNKMRR